MFLGLFIVLASLLTLLEEFGYITANVKWGLPLAFACFGLSLIFVLTHKPFFDNLIVAFFANDFDPRQVKS